MKVLQMEPDNGQANHQYGVVCERTMRMDEAIKFYEKVIETNKGLAAESYYGLGRIYFERQDLWKAKECLQNA